MAKPSKPNRPSNTKDKKPGVYSAAKRASSTLFNSLDSLIGKNSRGLLILILSIGVLFSLLLFQARMDIGGDDSGYILRAYDFIHKGVFPSFQGPLYPLVLSLFVSIVGIKIVFLKALSLIFNFVALLFLYKAFKGRIPALVLYSVLLLASINASILNFASLTYNEAFFMALQYVFMYYFFKLQDWLQHHNNASLKDSWRIWLPVGLLVFLMTYTRNIGISCLGGLVLYFLIRKQYRYILYLIGAFLAFEIPVNIIEKIFWHTGSQWGSQGNILLLKNPYNAAEGTENLNGFVMRFFQNCNLYLSKRFFQIIGLRSFDSIDTSPGLAFCFVLFFLFSVYRIIKSKNYYLLAVAMYVLSLTGVTFIVLQVQWDQPRLIMVFVPLYLMLFIYGLYDAVKNAAWAMQLLTVFLVLIVIISEFNATIKKTQTNLPILSKNLSGDIFYGFTPDWVNYLSLSQWCENLPKDSLVACRKGPMSSVYANGRPFYNVAKTDNIDVANADSVISLFKRNHVRYIMLAKLRLNPFNPDQGYINTMDRLIASVARTYPQKLKLVKQEGTSEEAQLYEILY